MGAMEAGKHEEGGAADAGANAERTLHVFMNLRVLRANDDWFRYWNAAAA